MKEKNKRDYFTDGVLIGGFIVFIVLMMYAKYKDDNTPCAEWDYMPSICSVYRNHYPEDCDMVSKIDSMYGCSVSVCTIGHECNPTVVCDEYYMCCNFEKVCVAKKIE